MSDRADRVNVQIWLPKALVKRLDHERIDREFRSRQALIEDIVQTHLEGLAEPIGGSDG